MKDLYIKKHFESNKVKLNKGGEKLRKNLYIKRHLKTNTNKWRHDMFTCDILINK